MRLLPGNGSCGYLFLNVSKPRISFCEGVRNLGKTKQGKSDFTSSFETVHSESFLLKSFHVFIN